MRHLVLLSALLISTGAPAAGPPAAQSPPGASAGAVPMAGNKASSSNCQRSDVIPAARSKPPRANKLGELPPGNVVMTVMREVDGCHKPVIVRYGIGSDGGTERQKARSRPPRR